MFNLCCMMVDCYLQVFVNQTCISIHVYNICSFALLVYFELQLYYKAIFIFLYWLLDLQTTDVSEVNFFLSFVAYFDI